MIAGVRGKVQQKLADSVLVWVGGFLLRVYVPSSTLDVIEEAGEVSLHTHLYLRDDSVALYGFRSHEELGLFQLLLTVTGVGPKAALSLLSGLPTPALASAIARQDSAALSRIPGIGKRTAERIVLELSGKVDPQVWAWTSTPDGRIGDEVLAALLALGYSHSEARAALRAVKLDGVSDVSEAVRSCLAYLAEQA